MFMNTNFFKGFLLGALVPFIAFYFYTTLVLKSELVAGFNQLVKDNLLTQVIAISVLANFIPLFVFNNRGENEKLRGVVSASIIYAFVISILYFIK